MLLCLAWLVALLSSAASVAVDNGVEGNPEIQCGTDGVTMYFNTKNNFEGHIYVKGLYNNADCRTDATGRQVASIRVPANACRTRRTRSLNPRGVTITTTVIISFHPMFVTKVDKAYRVECFYMETVKTVDAEIEASMLTTVLQTQSAPMPVCRYEILKVEESTLGFSLGDSVDYAKVGTKVYHQWTCDTESVNTFCMVVHSCYVDDTDGDRVDLVDAGGCAMDRYLLNNIEYATDLMGGVEAHVFKYADREITFFECQISIFVKEPGETCPRPHCSVPRGYGAGAANPTVGPRPALPRNPFPLLPDSPYLQSGKVIHGFLPGLGHDFTGIRRRFARDAVTEPVGTTDVITQMTALDMEDNSSAPRGATRRNSRINQPHANVANPTKKDICFETSALVVTASAVSAAMLVLIAVIAILVWRRKTG